MRVVLKGVHRTTKRLADGSRRVYYYAWAGGPRLDGEPGSPEFVASYTAAYAERREPPKGVLFSLISSYRRSSEFVGLAEKTRKDYGRYLKLIEDEFGDMPQRALEDTRARGDFKEWRDGFMATPRKADMAWTVLARVLAWSKDKGRLSVNVCEKGGRLYGADRSENVWTEDQIERAAGLPEHLRRVFMLALWTGQRQGDLLRLPWSAYDGRRITLTQSKTGARVVVKAGGPLRDMLDAMPRECPVILTSTDKMPWTGDGFRSSWGRGVARLGIEGVTFHDLRGTAITRLAEAGCTESEICSITGHDQGYISTVLGRYLARNEKLAAAGITKLERADRKRKLQTASKPVTQGGAE
jgi:integrase